MQGTQFISWKSTIDEEKWLTPLIMASLSNNDEKEKK